MGSMDADECQAVQLTARLGMNDRVKMTRSRSKDAVMVSCVGCLVLMVRRRLDG
jgi:hypothetical protein